MPHASTGNITIGEAARRSGLTVKTIRYYDEIGLVRPRARAANGYRAYADNDVHCLRFVHHARDLGFTIEETTGLLSLYNNEHRQAAEVKALAVNHIAAIDAKIAELARMRATLLHLMEACAGDDRPTCPILEGLADGPKAAACSHQG